MKVKKIEHKIDSYQYEEVDGILATDYSVDHNQFRITSKVKNNDIYLATTYIKLNEKDDQKIDQIFNELASEVVNVEEGNLGVTFMQSRLVIDVDGKEYDLCFNNNFHFTNAIEDIIHVLRENHMDEIINHGNLIDCIFDGKIRGIPGIEKIESKRMIR